MKDLTPNSLCVRYFLLLFLISIFFFGKILYPFWSILVLSFLLTNIFRPTYFFLTRSFSNGISSAITCILIILIVFVPLTIFLGALSNEALALYNWGKSAQVGVNLQPYIQENPIIISLQTYLKDLGFSFDSSQLSVAISKFAKTGGLFLYNQASSWAANIMNFVFMFFIMILIIFFLLIDQDELKTFIAKLSPLPEEEDRLLIRKFEQIATAILKGNGICGLVQGTLGGIVFAILGISSPILWGGVMVILAFLPIFGIGLVMVPTAIYLGFTTSIGTGVFLFVFYILLSFIMEYLIKPKMVGYHVKMHTLMVFLSIIGGLSVYGIMGIIYGPLIITAFLTLSEIYLHKYDIYVKQ